MVSLYFLCVWLFYLFTCQYITFVPGALRGGGGGRGVGSPGTELEKVVSHHVGAKSQTRVLC